MASETTPEHDGSAIYASHNWLKLILAWGFVGIPLTWGVVQTLVNALKAFHS
jgi:hypothetical protein